ncbi:MAG: DUF6717 family protein [Bacteroidota bacterium]
MKNDNKTIINSNSRIEKTPTTPNQLTGASQITEGISTVHEFDFYRDNTGWYIDFPEFLAMGLGTMADLAMVSGADTMLEYLGNGNNRVTTKFSDQPLLGANIALKMCARNGWGATYTTNVDAIPTVWLCNVTKIIFGGTHPPQIFVKTI